MRKILVIILIVFSLVALNSQTLVAGLSSPADSPMFMAVSQYMSELGDITGLNFVVRSMPLDRSKSSVINGSIDIDLGRTIFVYNDQDPVIYVPTPVLVQPMFIISDEPSIDSEDRSTWGHLKLVTTRGNAVINDWIDKNSFPQRQVVYVQDDVALGLMIASNRADFAIAGMTSMPNITSSEQAQNSGIEMHPPALFNSPSFIVLAAKHRNLTGKIDEGIKQLLESGRTAQIFGGGK